MKKSRYVPDDYPMAHPRESGGCALFTFAQSAEMSCPDEKGGRRDGLSCLTEEERTSIPVLHFSRNN
jgi:hypothetical protein